ncbi:MAG: SusE domain-containing protein [Bacteroidota bacterium]|nr:SusE domain-containing protein [Bacteroidota bacterium]
MKFIKTLFFFLFFTALITGCEKEDNRAQFEGGTSPSLTGSKTIVRLTPATENEVAITFNWTNPNYRFNTGTSSQDVSYSLEIDTMGANFNSPNKYVLSVSKELSKTFTERELNSILGNSMLLPVDRPYNLQARVVSSIAGSTATRLVSNTWNFRATPFNPPPKVELPASGRLFIVGNATPGGWDNPVPIPAQEFTKISDTKFEITIPLSAGAYYLFLPVNGSWDAKYAVPDNSVAGLSTGGDFQFYTGGGQDIPGPAEAGTYKITVDFQTGKFTVVKQ